MSRRFLTHLVLAMVLGPGVPVMAAPDPAAVDAAIQRGADWLEARQNSDGSFGPPPLAPRDSAAALGALLAAGRAGRAVPAGIAWLAGARGAAVQFGSARALALAGAGRPFASLLESLAVLRGEGGFGAHGSHAPNLFDTALAARALALEEPARLIEILPLVDFLLLHQNADGGWGFLPGEPSDLYFTAEVAATLASLERLAVARGPLERAAVFLAARQQADGGFGGSLETAEAYRALLALGFPTLTLGVSPAAFLLARQNADGSWDGETFVTGRVIQALSRELPNLGVSEVGAPESVRSGEPVPLAITVRNTGPAPAPAAVVSLREGGALRDELPLGPLEPGAEETLSTEIDSEGSSGELALSVTVDPANEVRELDETDNEASVRVAVRRRGDLAVFAPDLTTSLPAPLPDTEFTLRIGARNLGESTVEAFTYRLSLLPEESAPQVLSEGSAGPAAPGAGVAILVPLELPRGEHRLRAELDPAGEVSELSESNNAAERTVAVGAGDRPDFVVDEAEIVLLPPRPAPGESVVVEVVVRNEGEAPGEALLEVFAGAPEDGVPPVDARRVSLAAGGAESATSVFTMAPGTVLVTAVVDRPGEVAEVEEGNNRASRALVDRPNLAIGHDGLSWDVGDPVEGTAVEIAITVRNSGSLPSAPAALEVFDGEPEAAGALLFETRLAEIPAGGNRTEAFVWTASGGLRDLVAVVDRHAELDEIYESDNRVRRTIAVARPSGPDLRIAGVDVSRFDPSPFVPAVAGQVAVEIANAGEEAAPAPFGLRLYEDRDGDGRFASGDRLLASTRIAEALPAGTSSVLSLSVDSAVEFHRPVLRAEVDPDDEVAERREDDNQLRVPAPCEVDAVPGLEPRQEWHLGGLEVESVPLVVQLTDEDRNGVIDSRDGPDVVFMTEGVSGPAITARSGLDASEHWTLHSTPELPLASRLAHLAAADLDGDGVAEILGASADGRVLALDRRGRVLWVSAEIESAGGRLWAGGMAVGDLTGDGVPEIALGRTVLSAAGEVVAVGTANTGRNRNFFGPLGVPYLLDAPLSVIADIDLDGVAELVAGDAVYRLEGDVLRVVWDRSVPDRLMEDGYVALGDLDSDPEAEIVYVSSNRIMLLEHDGSILAAPREVSPLRSASEASFWGGPPALADLDGDGRPEILVPAYRELVAFDSDLALLWRHPTSDRSEQAGAVGFDLDGDGAAEVLYADETEFAILAGAGGEALYRRPNTSKTGTEYPVVADVDGDGVAEVLVASNASFDGDGSTRGLHLLGHPGWRSTLPVWNQHSYHVTNVALDGTVPAAEAPSWRALDSYRSNAELPRRRQPLANLTVGVPRTGEAGKRGVAVRLRVGNGGAAWAPAGVAVTLHEGDPQTSPAVGSAVTTRALAPGDWEDVEAFWQAPGAGSRTAVAAVDPGDRVVECEEGDNRVEFELTESVLPDLSIAAGGVRLSALPVAGQIVPVAVGVTNAGAAIAPPTEVRLLQGPPALGRVAGRAELPALEPGEEAVVEIPWQAAEPGTWLLRALADPDDLLVEVSEANNLGLVAVETVAAQRPDLSLESLAALPARAAAGEKVILEAEVRNRGAELPGGFELAFLANGAEFDRAASVERLPAGGSRVMRSALETSGLGGGVEVAAIADPDGDLEEESESNNRAQAELFVTEGELGLEVRTDRPIYGPGETVRLEVAVENRSGSLRSPLLMVDLLEPASGRLRALHSETLEAAPGQATRSLFWETGRNPAGIYRVGARLIEGGTPVAEAGASFGVESRTDLEASLVVDPPVASALDTVRLSGFVVNRGTSQAIDGLEVVVTVGAPSGETAFSGGLKLAALAAESSRGFSFDWTVDGAPPGIYAAQLRVLDPAGLERAAARQAIEVDDGSETGEGLRGSLDLLTARLGAGASLEAVAAVANEGNADFPELELRVDVVSLPDGLATASRGRVLPLDRGAAVSLELEVPTADLEPGDYLAALVAGFPRSEIVLDSVPVALESGLSVSDAAVEEGDDGAVWLEFGVSLLPAAEREVSVEFSTRDGTARAGLDYAAASGTLSFAPGETERTVRVEVVGDLEAEPDELLVLGLEKPAGALLADGLALGRILDDEGCPGPELLVNPGAEDGARARLSGWTVEGGEWRRRASRAVSGVAYFQSSGSGEAELSQEMDLTPYAESIDLGVQKFALQGFVQAAEAAGRLVLEFRDAAGLLLAASDAGAVGAGEEWTGVETSAVAPPGSRSARVRLLALGLRAPADRVGFDALSLRSLGTVALSVSPAAASEGGGEASAARFEVRLSCPRSGGVDLDYSTSDGTAQAGRDYVAASGVLSLSGEESSGGIDVEILDDLADESEEEFWMNVTAPAGVAVLVGRARGRILDDDAPVEVRVEDGASLEGGGSPAVLSFTVSLSAPSERTVEVAFATVEGTATAGEDYRSTAGRLLFEPGIVEQTVDVPLLDDALEEPDERLELSLSDPVHARLATARAIGTIQDDDPVSVSVGDARVVEGDGGTPEALFEVRLSHSSARAIEVGFVTADGEAVAGEDYVAAGGTLEFPPGTLERMASVPVVDDEAIEPIERFELILTSTSAGRLEDGVGVGTIVDDDAIQIAIGDAAAIEGDGPSARVVLPVTLSRAAESEVTVEYRTVDGTAVAGEDYLPESGTLVLPAGSDSASLAVELLGDAVDEPAERFSVRLASASVGVLLDAEGEVTILDDDGWVLGGDAAVSSLPGCLVVTPDAFRQRGSAWRSGPLDLGRSFDRSFRVFLGDKDADGGHGMAFMLQTQGTGALSPRLGGLGIAGIAPSAAVEIDTREKTGDPPFDHLAVDLHGVEDHAGRPAVAALAGPANVEDGVEHLLRVAWNAPMRQLDVHFDGDERLIWERDLVAEIFGGEASVHWGFVGATDIHHNLQYFCPLDPCFPGGGRPVLSVGDVEVEEGDAGRRTAMFAVTLSCPVDSEVRVSFGTMDGTARAGEDYAPDSGELVFPPGETAVEIGVDVLGDVDAEPHEDFAVRLSNPRGALLRHAEGLGRIVSDELPVAVGPVEIAEGDESRVALRLTARLASPPTEAVALDFATRDGTATAGADYRRAAGSLPFEAGQTAGSFDLVLFGDTTPEGDEELFVDLTDPDDRLAPSRASIVLRDDDACPSANLLANPGAEEPPVDGELPGWVEVEGDGWTRQSTSAAFEGEYYFHAGATELAELRQDVDLSGFAAVIDSGREEFELLGQVTTFDLSGRDLSRIVLEYRDAANVEVLGAFDSGEVDFQDRWRMVQDVRRPPAGTRWARVRLISRRQNGTSNDGNFDALVLRSLRRPAFAASDLEVEEGGAGRREAEFPVSLSCAAEASTSIDYFTLDGSARAGSDYAPVRGTLVFAPGETLKSVAVPILGDTLSEGEESFDLVLLDPRGAALARRRATAWIEDDESALAVADVSLLEGGPGSESPARFPVRLSRPSEQTVAVEFATVDGTARAGSDYRPAAGTLVFAPGETLRSIEVSVVGDGEAESDEVFFVELARPRNAILERSRARATILQDDLSVEVHDASVREGDGEGVAAVRVTLAEASSGPVTVDFATATLTATAGQDYLDVSGTLSFAPGQREARLEVPVVGDHAAEPGETFLIGLGRPLGARLGRAEATVFILDDDDCPTPEMARNGGGEEALEAGEVPGWTRVSGSWRRRLNGDPPDDGRFQLAAVADPAAELRQEVDLSGFARQIDAGTQRFLFSGFLRTPDRSSVTARVLVEYHDGGGAPPLSAFDTGRLSTGGRWRQVADLHRPPPGTRSARVRLQADDASATAAEAGFDGLSFEALGTPALSIAGARRVEGDAGTTDADFAVSLTCPLERAAAVDYATSDATAVAGIDYLARAGRLALESGAAAAVVTVPILGDTEDEAAESFWVGLAGPSGAALLAPVAEGVILDDDAGLADAGGPYSGVEGSALAFDASDSAPVDGSIVSYAWDLDGDGEFADSSGVVAQRAYVEDGDYAVGVRVTDDAGRVDDDWSRVAIANAPPIVEAGADRAHPEGALLEIEASFGDPGAEDTHHARVDWGDGSESSVDAAGDGGVGSVSAAHGYADDGSFRVEVCVSDDDGGTGCDDFGLEVQNRPPRVAHGAVDFREWTAETLEAPGLGPVRWEAAADGSSVTQRLNGSPTFYYGDLAARGSGLRATAAVRTTRDDDFFGFALGFLPGDTRSPQADFLLVDWKREDQEVRGCAGRTHVARRGLAISRVSGVTVPAELSAHLDLPCIEPGQGVEELARGVSLGAEGWAYETEYEFSFEVDSERVRVFVDGALELEVAGRFGDGRLALYDSSQAEVEFRVVNPVFFTGSEGGPLGISVPFVDAGRLDTHTATVTWGDGALQEGAVEQGSGVGRIAAEHRYLDDGAYTLTLCVADDGGLEGCGSFPVQILNLPPEVEAGSDLEGIAGQALALAPATFEDPGILDLHSASVDWGDGGGPRPAEVVEAGGSGTVAGSHVFVGPGEYRVTVCVEDDDLAAACDSLTATVLPPPALRAALADTLSADRDGDGVASPGDALAYRLEVFNDGGVPAGDLVTSVPVPAHTSLVEESVQATAGNVTRLDPIRLEIAELPPGARAVLGFEVVIDDPVAADVRQIEAQGEIVAAGASPVVTDDPDSPGDRDPTVTPVVAAPKLAVEKTDVLFADADADGRVSAGDVLLYMIRVVNLGNTSATQVTITDQVPANTRFEPGSIEAGDGTVVGQDPVRVLLGEVPGRASATLSFRVRIDDPFPPGSLRVSNQARVESAELEAVESDDPATEPPGDPTATEVYITPELSIGDASATESAAASGMEFELRLSTQGNREVAARYLTRDETARAGADYVAATGSVTITAGETTRTVGVPVLDDALLEPDETFLVEIIEVSGATISDGIGVGTLVDDELCPGPDLLFNPGAEELPGETALPGWIVVGGDWGRRSADPPPSAGNAYFIARAPLVAELRQDVDLSAYAGVIDGGEQQFRFSGRVRTASGGPPVTARIVVEYRDAGNVFALDAFDSGEQVSGEEWLALEDRRAVPSGTRWARVRLLAHGSGDETAAAYFDALELASLRTPVLLAGDSGIEEGDAGGREMPFEVRLSCASALEVRFVRTTGDGTAVAGEDYVALPAAEATIAPGEVLREIPVLVWGDARVEGDEFFFLDLASPENAVLRRARAIGLILDDDAISFCPRSPGFWKNHGEAWPVERLALGGVTYRAHELMAFLRYGGRDATLKLARQLVAARLNLAAGSDPAVLPTAEDADGLLAAHPPGSEPGGEARHAALRLKDDLDLYNNTPCEED